MTTLATVLARHDIDPADALLADIDVPVLTGLQRQGDVLIVPRPPLTPAERAAMTPVAASGIPVVRGEATGNTHILSPEPGTTVLWAANTDRTSPLLLGVMEVSDGGVVWMIHTDEHGANGVGHGTYDLKGKREQAEEERRVQD